MTVRSLLAAAGAVCVLVAWSNGDAKTGLPAVKAPVVAPPQQRARLAVVRQRFGELHSDALVLMGSGGGNRTTLAQTTRFLGIADPAWSPDGRQIYFTGTVTQSSKRYLYGKQDVFRMRVDGHDLRQVTGFGDAAAPVLSPDGRWMVFERLEQPETFPPSSALWLARTDGTGARRLVSRVAGAFDAPGAWSPDGHALAFTRCRFAELRRRAPLPCAVYEVTTAGSEPRLLAANGASPAYSPDGMRIAFVSDRDRNGTFQAGSDETRYAAELYVMDAGGGHQRRLTRTRELDEQSPSWSPDGAWIAYARQGPNILVAQVMRSRADGTCPTRIVGNAEIRTALTFKQPRWRPGRIFDRRFLRCRTG
jgi:Tol biopolymer transport system component